MDAYIKFLGTAGARFAVARQILASGGLWFACDRTNLLIDPGPGSLVRCTSSRPRLDPANLDGIVLTHKHLDHSVDVNVMIEAMTDGGFARRGVLLAPRDALEDDPVVLRYVRGALERIELLEVGRQTRIGGVTVQAAARHVHPVETYGLRLTAGASTVGLVADTLYFDGLPDHYVGCDVLIVNVVRLDANRPGRPGTCFTGPSPAEMPMQHLCMDDAARIIAAVKPRVAVLTHFGMSVIKARPWEIAREMSQRLGVNVLAARDGMQLAV